MLKLGDNIFVPIQCCKSLSKNVLFTGTYIPRKEVVVEETILATVIKPNQAIKLRARKECIARDNSARVTGEEWLVKKVGAYLPGPYEEVVDIVNAYVLTEKVGSATLFLKFSLIITI